MSKIKLSIIIVHYKVKNELVDCIDSIYKSQPKIPYETIVVDNDEKKTIEQELKKFFPKVEYIKTLENNGFGAGNNVGVRNARGEFLFILSPDTKIFPGTIEGLVEIFQSKKNTGIVAPLLLDRNGQAYPLQGSGELTPLRGMIVLSFINKLFPKNPISDKYWLKAWDKKNIIEVDVAPGTAFVIRKEVFERVGGFDKRFFLYFEESDLCRRVKKLGYKIYINPQSRLFHSWGASTKDIKTYDIFSRSRFFYFRKHFGFIPAVAVHIATNTNVVNVLLVFVLIIASFLRFYRLEDLMMFIGDQGWFYISARDLILKGEIPIVGITSSHTWLHQGALWTYMLSAVLWLFNFNPVGGAYFSSLLGVLTVYVVYWVGKNMFSRRIGLIAAFLYATSPLIIIHARMAYHTTPIPLFTIILFYSVYKWIRGNVLYFPFIMFLLAILYNFELATFVLVPIIIIFILSGFVTKKEWAKRLLNKKIILLSFLGFIFPMISMIIYDFGHGFPQTLKFVLWVGYKIAVTLHLYPPLHPDAPSETYQTMIPFASMLVKRLIFLESERIAWLIFAISFMYLTFIVYRQVIKKSFLNPFNILFLFFIIPAFGYIAAKTNSEGYILIFFPIIILMIGILFNRVISNRLFLVSGIFILSTTGIINSYSLVSKNYLMKNGYGVPMRDRVNIAKRIIRESGEKEYNIVGVGDGSQYESFTDAYEYLTWWLGKPTSKNKTNMQFIIQEKPNEVILKKIKI